MTEVHNATQNSSDNLSSYLLQITIIAQMLYIGGEGGCVFVMHCMFFKLI